MKSRTSFFNLTVLRKNLTRFAPLWALTAIVEVLCLLIAGMEESVDAALYVTMLMNSSAIWAMIYAFAVAACLFGDLFNSRICNGLHALPIRREGWLLTNLVSGFLFALIPSFVGGVVASVILEEYYWVGLLWQGTILLQFVFFFGLAVFSAICAGKGLGMLAIYVLINFMAVLIYWIADLFYQPLLPGVVLSSDAFTLFSPVVPLSGAEYVKSNYEKLPTVTFEGFFTESWTYLYICVGVGIVFLLLSWLLYRKRHLETAGDFISYRPVKMVFLLAYTFAVGAFFHSVFGAVSEEKGNYGFLIVGVLIGWFTGWMLLERTVKVFTKRVILGFAAFGLLFAGSMGLTALDPLGVTSRIPKTEEVESVCLYSQDDFYYYNYGWESGGWYRTEADEIAQVQQLHQQMITMPKEENTETVTTYIDYRLKNGKEIQRAYDVPVGSQTAKDLSNNLSNIKAVLGTNDDWENIKGNISSISIYWNGNRPTTMLLPYRKEVTAVLEAFEADCQAGAMAQHPSFHEFGEPVAHIEICWEDQEYGAREEYLTVYPNCDHLYVLLRQM